MRRIVVYSDAGKLPEVSQLVQQSGGRILKSLPLARALVVDLSEADVDSLTPSNCIVRVDDEIPMSCD